MKLEELTIEAVLDIMAQREEILRAYVAKYGFDPDEAVQVIQQTESGTKWCIRKMSKAERAMLYGEKP